MQELCYFPAVTKMVLKDAFRKTFILSLDSTIQTVVPIPFKASVPHFKDFSHYQDLDCVLNACLEMPPSKFMYSRKI